MSPVTARRHALLARELIAQCGGPREAAEACRLNRSRLSECQTPDSEAFLPIDVVADLEAYCGKPTYSQALVDARPAAATAVDVVDGVSEVTEESADLQHLVRSIRASGRAMTPRERLVVDAAILKLKDELEDVQAGVEADGMKTVVGLRERRRGGGS